VSDFEDKEAHLVKGLQQMKDLRLGNGRWRAYLFCYVIYILSEIDLEAAHAEMKYAPRQWKS
jgi:hypothetical protein